MVNKKIKAPHIRDDRLYLGSSNIKKKPYIKNKHLYSGSGKTNQTGGFISPTVVSGLLSLVPKVIKMFGDKSIKKGRKSRKTRTKKYTR